MFVSRALAYVQTILHTQMATIMHSYPSPDAALAQNIPIFHSTRS